MPEPRNPHFEQAVRASFAAQQLMATIGARITRVAAGEIEIRVSFRPDLTQQHGFLHAGVVTSALDSACGYAAFTLMPEGVGVLTVEFKTNLLAPARGEELIARAHVVRAGRRGDPGGYDAGHDHDGSGSSGRRGLRARWGAEEAC